MERLVVLITGCSSGIGLSLAVRLAADPRGAYKVYATMRNVAKKERLMECVKGSRKDTMDVLQMDVTDQQSILEARDMIKEKRVDILVCNAGVGLIGPLEVQSLEVMRQILEVNVLGTIRTIQAFLPGMKARRSGRVLVTGSVGGLQGLPFNEVYCASKFAVEGVCESLAILLQHFNIHVSLIECGPVNTNFLANLRRPEPDEETLTRVDPRTRALYDTYLQHCDEMFQDAAQEAEDIAEVFLEAIRSQSPALRYYTNSALLPLTTLKLAARDGSQYVKSMSQFVFSSHKAQEP
ncbi:17-beta-hydroxysteroid dehydrogenase type 1 isoform X2 [Scleropages formosus]|uniref:Estradiol 17-beta-dehydrogenase n=1 Tax=Scleropages formosus TaxID=113540 RepID=A0A8C9V9Q8_SCLFO|nr:estradiol 17-beta-dehydrogenase 1 isoform X2 [Scleropages formosus]